MSWQKATGCESPMPAAICFAETAIHSRDGFLRRSSLLRAAIPRGIGCSGSRGRGDEREVLSMPVRL
jgi:hypothetical protein